MQVLASRRIKGEICNWIHWLYMEENQFTPKAGHWIPREITKQLIFLLKNREDTKEHSQLPTDKRTKRKPKIFEFGCLALPLDLKSKHWTFKRQRQAGTHIEHQGTGMQSGNKDKERHSFVLPAEHQRVTSKLVGVHTTAYKCCNSLSEPSSLLFLFLAAQERVEIQQNWETIWKD